MRRDIGQYGVHEVDEGPRFASSISRGSICRENPTFRPQPPPRATGTI